MPLLSSLSRHVFHPLLDLKEGSRRLAVLRDLERSQWLPLEALRAVQNKRLRDIVRYAGEHSDYYRALFALHAFDPARFEMAQFHSLPVLTKADIRSSTDRLISRDFQRADLGHHKTGGSTGVSLTTYFDKEWLQVRSADALRADQWAGSFHGMKVGAVWGNPPTPRGVKSKLRSELIERMVYLDTMNLNEASMDDFIRRWRDEGVAVLFGHSHSIYMFARHVLARNVTDLRPRGIVSTSMMLLRQEREVIENAFGCKVTDRYGCEEVGLIACECERHAGFHLNIEHLYIEFLRADGTHAAPGEEGAIVVTDLLNRGMPLIRYRIEDVGVPAPQACPCGRGLPLMERVTGRVADYLKRADGSMVAGVSLVERSLTAIEGIEQMQIVQDAMDLVRLNVVTTAAFGPAAERELLQEFESVFGPEVRIQIDRVDSIPQERSGKYRFSICRVP